MGVICCKEEPVDLNSEIDLTHFALLRSVGKGAFGKVRVVQHKGTKQLFALKYINKAKCIRMHAVENIISERRLLERLDYKLIVNLRYAFQDDDNLFMVLDLMLGGDLRFHMDRMGIMTEECVRFYAAEISLGLHYLHQQHIVHRDLKPDNILLDECGHAHLTDFNIAVQFSENKPLLSVAGSMAYMAPEILKKRGYFASVDWWSLGIVCYEMLFGKRPFKAKTNDALKQAILNEQLEFPDDPPVSPEAIQVIKGLLTRDVSQRLGVGDQGFQDLKSHPWFKTIQWQRLEAKQVEPPFIPDDKRANFDPTHELEEILLEDNPLKAKKRMAKKCGSNTDVSDKNNAYDAYSDPEYQVMEDKFLTFDYTKPEQNLQQKQQQQKHYNVESPPTSPRLTAVSSYSNHRIQLPDEEGSSAMTRIPSTLDMKTTSATATSTTTNSATTVNTTALPSLDNGDKSSSKAQNSITNWQLPSTMLS
ncbi:putative camp-dependent protein kinase [Halteromyces radiatus]|uniref:putative camp-dependent protein kinase n=1 Tax=Halteromyces radiatus TaxID=101107 RepID=UPI002220FBFA|nr:putative camp-dependent protein kinase [Halteromyces radiatus]KAI8093540.1 putative camp-dependent protein kinase [Halteromyces radiatus]